MAIYNAPTFVNGQPPALSADVLNPLVQAVEQDGVDIQTLQTQQANPYSYKGTVAAVSDLPSSDNTINDTYYVTAEGCLYTWNGSAWSQSSVKETDYQAALTALAGNFAGVYSNAATYAVGDYCVYNNVLYRCITAISTSEEWTAAHWTVVTATGEVADVKSASNALRDEVGVSSCASKNLADPSKFGTGTRKKDGTTIENTRKYTDYIKVNEGDVIRFYYSANLQDVTPFNFTNICAYDSSKSVVSSAGIDDNNINTTYTVPSGVSYIIATCSSVYTSKMMITKEVVTAYEAYFAPYTEYTKDVMTQETKALILQNCKSDANQLSNSMASMSDGDVISLDCPHTTRNIVYACDFETDQNSFTKIIFGRDYSGNYSFYIELDATQISYCIKVNGVLSKSSYNHGLTIDGHVTIVINVPNITNQASIKVQANGGMYENASPFNFNGARGSVLLESVGSTITNAFISAYSDTWNKGVALFWDSYETFVGKYMVEDGATKCSYDGFPGRTVIGAKTSFDELLEIRVPEIVIWGLGMNNGDSSSAINADWDNVRQYVEDVCTEKGIKLIYLTIPNTPIVRNTYKNAYIRNSGYEYVDVAKAVGADSAGSSWYTGLLSSDNVHPTAQGSKIIANYIVSMLPSLCDLG